MESLTGPGTGQWGKEEGEVASEGKVYLALSSKGSPRGTGKQQLYGQWPADPFGDRFRVWCSPGAGQAPGTWSRAGCWCDTGQAAEERECCFQACGSAAPGA